MSETGDMSIGELKALRAEQAEECGEPMEHNACAAFWSGFPPSCSIVNPASYRADYESDALEPDTKTPMESAATYLEEQFGPQNALNLKEKFGIETDYNLAKNDPDIAPAPPTPIAFDINMGGA